MKLPKSFLPVEPQYWEALADRVARDAAEPLRSYADWSGVLARRAPWWLAASVAAMLALWLSLPSRSPAGYGWAEHMLAPSDAAGAMLVGPTPPSVDSLMSQFPLEAP